MGPGFQTGAGAGVGSPRSRNDKAPPVGTSGALKALAAERVGVDPVATPSYPHTRPLHVRQRGSGARRHGQERDSQQTSPASSTGSDRHAGERMMFHQCAPDGIRTDLISPSATGKTLIRGWDSPCRTLAFGVEIPLISLHRRSSHNRALGDLA